MTEQLRGFVIRTARDALTQQCRNGAMPAGHNGPYFHPERALRNTGHWMITWCHVHRWTAQQEFREAAERALHYILLPEHRPHIANWWHRSMEKRDRCNGAIGAAWTIEALVCAYKMLGADDALRSATEVFELHPFNKRLGMWKRLEVDGSVLSYDRTFNHQLWLASSAARLAAAGVPSAAERVECFLDCLTSTFSVYPSGLIRHRIRMYWFDRYLEPGAWLHKLYLRLDVIRGRSRAMMNGHARDIGYHAFNLHAFAVLNRFYPKHPFWGSRDFQSALAFARSEAHVQGVSSPNRYAYPYNPVGFEMANAIKQFFPSQETEVDEWIDRQLHALSTPDGFGYGEATDDPSTALARIYEAVELFD